ncbi:hypothetical protein GCM10009678_57190 [Actinomadura kijaniata]|uniref:RNA polymerase sigma factor (Sigma-70 family) n=1 Tax=Actinomadura namibiensis TaxID=182080 RepID=A0A7W3QK85_ACTNM|nr:sigma-70 family RNA polymerase sigma factor [Actinomadura namibiensis]MBA8950155.1 RNA polymerase sigma factor (sigma-70 family) [Actinomadura namibiensis]
MGKAASGTAPTGTAPEPSDAVLIARIRSGDPEALGPLFERHRAAARGLAGHLIGGDAADDAVQNAFERVLDAIRRGGGPRSGFRPYLLTAVRNSVYDMYRNDRRLHTTDRMEPFDPGLPFDDPALEGMERTMIVQAYRSLPERWQTVLWHTVVEGARPADVAPLLGLTPNGAAALAYRAREGLRQAYLQMHLARERTAEHAAPGVAAGAAVTVDARCRPVLDKLGAYVRDGLARRDARRIEEHLDDCARCQAIHAELVDVNTTLREALGPVVLGTAGVAYLAAAKAGVAGGGIFGWFRHLPKRQQQALGAGAAGLAIMVGTALAMVPTGGKKPITPAARPPVAAPPAPKPQPPEPRPPRPRPPEPKPPEQKPPKPSPRPNAPRPAPPPPPERPARLTASIGAVGTLLRQQTGIVAMAVRNDGTGRSENVVADVDLPPDVAYRGAASGRNSAAFTPLRPPGDGWNCRPRKTPTTPAPDAHPTGTRAPGANATGIHVPGADAPGADVADVADAGHRSDPRRSRVRCTHAPIKPGDTTSAYLDVHVGDAAPYATPPRVTLRSGGHRVTARADRGVAPDGMPARFAVDGNVRTVQTGNALLTCDPERPGCRAALDRRGHRRDNDFWEMVPADRDDDPKTASSSAARLDLPPGAKVLWAGLYWSGAAPSGRGDDPVTARLRGPGGGYRAVRPAETRRDRLPGYPAYQAFADVTAQVREHGGGTWWGADVPTRDGSATHAGWSLVAVVADPGAPYQQAMVLDAVRALGPHRDDHRRFDVPVNGLLAAARPARIGLVAWEGDADLSGDRLLLDGQPLTPAAGDRDAGNVLDGSSDGAVGPGLTFGIDVDYFTAVLDGHATLTLTTRRDALLAGVVTVTAPMRS